MRVAVFGLGYVGSVTAAYFAQTGQQVVGVDVNPEKVDLVNNGRSPVLEDGVEQMVGDAVRRGRLRATTDALEAGSAVDVAFVCVGTPGHRRGECDTTAIRRVASELGCALRYRTSPLSIVLRSTAPPGTVERVLWPSLCASADAFPIAVHVACNPEFMREGNALRDFVEPPFVLVGSEDPVPVSVLRELYSGVKAEFLHTNVRTAELVKYASNAFHALEVCFANEIGDLCEAVGADGQAVMEVFAKDRKLNISDAYLKPGFAFGGSCLPKDLRSLLHLARTYDLASPLLSAILPSNEARVHEAVAQILAIGHRRVGVVGLAFKPGTDDLRESPMVAVVEALIGKGWDIRIFDANVSLSRLVGANRAFIEREIPHLASLLLPDLAAVVAHAETLVIGCASEDAHRAISAATPTPAIVNLSRSMSRAAEAIAP